jgi:polyhydroxyalkanoate synthesis regulator phasin
MAAVTSAMSSLGNDSAEVVLQEWVKRAKASQREGSRLMARFIRDAQREQGRVQRQVGTTAHDALLGAAGMLRREVDQLQRGLKVVSKRLETFEKEQAKAPARTPARRVRRTTAGPVRRTTATKRRSTRKAA